MDLSVLAERLTEIEWAEQTRDLDPGQDAWVCPVWQMRPPRADLGRKRADLVPVRCEYDATPDATDSGQRRWRIDSLGVTETAVAEPSRRRVGDLRTNGNIARWEMIEHFRTVATAETRKAHSSLALSVGGDLLSNTTLVGLVDDFILDEFPASVLGRVNAEGTCRKVDPERWLRVAIRNRMRELVRQRLDDPREGVAIRAASSALGTTDVERIVQHFESAASRPRRSRITGEAVRKALSLWMSADPMLSWRRIEQEDHR